MDLMSGWLKQLRKEGESSTPSLSNAPVKWVPKSYQASGLKFLIANGAGGLLWDPGLGKTSAILAAFKTLKKKKIVDCLFVIAPLRVCYSTWNPENPESDFAKFTNFNKLKVAICHGPTFFESLESKADVYVMNPQGIDKMTQRIERFGRLTKSVELSQWGLKWFRSAGNIMFALDESTRYKHTNTSRFKRIKQCMPYFKRRYIMTGTFSPNGYQDIFGQVYVLDQGGLLGRSLTAYRQTFFDGGGYGGYTYTLKEGAADRITKLIAPIMHRLDANDYISLPPKIETDIKLSLPPKVKKIYAEIKKEFIVKLKNGEVTAANAGVLSSKMRQIANGGIYHNDKRVEHLHMEKAEAVKTIVDELQGKAALIAYDTHHDLARLKKVLGKDTPHIGSGVSVKKGVAIEAAWNAGQVPYLLAHPASVAHGLNFQKTGRAIIWHSLPWDLENYIQFTRRIYRQGQQHKVYVYHLLMLGTIDMIIKSVLIGKGHAQRQLLDALENELLA